jgi:hypothetical protein
MTDTPKQVIQEKDGGAAKRAAEGDPGSCCSTSCCSTAEGTDPIPSNLDD